MHGAGGLGDLIIIGECVVDVYVPPARAAEYSCDVTSQAVSFDPTTGSYLPDPFQVTATVTNTGLADGMGLTAEISLESGLFLATGQSPTQTVPGILAPSATSAPLPSRGP